MWWIASHYFSDSFECSLYVIFNCKEELSGSCLISSELANSYAVNPHEKHISRGLSVSKYLSSDGAIHSIHYVTVFSGICVIVIWKLSSSIHWGKKHFPVDKCKLNQFSYLLNSDLLSGLCFLSFQYVPSNVHGSQNCSAYQFQVLQIPLYTKVELSLVTVQQKCMQLFNLFPPDSYVFHSE